MSFKAFKAKIDEIAADIGARYREGVSDEAENLLRAAIHQRTGEAVPISGGWTCAEDEDFALVLEHIDELMKIETRERILSRAELHGGHLVLRPTSVAVEGKKYRLLVVRLFAENEEGALKWVAQVTPTCRALVWGYRTAELNRKSLRKEFYGEQAAHKAMKEIAETVFRVKLEIA